jgi:hypothetical protein
MPDFTLHTYRLLLAALKEQKLIIILYRKELP